MTSVQALQAALAGEHAAIYVVDVLGGRTSWSRSPDLYNTLRAAYDAHVAARETLAKQVVGAGQTPVGPAAAYDLPSGLDSPTGILKAALRLEQECTARYLSLVPAAAGADRRLLIDLLGDTAVRQLDFGGRPTTFPGT